MADKETTEGSETQADEETTSQEDSTDTQAGGGESTTLSAEDARKLRSEARSLRQRLKAAEQKLGERDEADLTEKQRLERDKTGLEAKISQLETDLRDRSVQVVAAKVGVRPDLVDAVAKLIDWDEIDDPNDSRQVERAVKDLLKERPSLSGRQDLDGGNGRRTGGGEIDINEMIRSRAGRAAS